MLGKLPHAPFLNNEMMRIKIVFLNNCRVHRMAFVSAIFGVFGLILLSILLRFVMLNRSSKHDLSFFTITYKPLSRLRYGFRSMSFAANLSPLRLDTCTTVFG